MNTKEKIEKILLNAFRPQRIHIDDESALHAGHAQAIQSGGGHFSLTIVSEMFNNKRLIERHRMIYDCLKKEMKGGIHALKVKAYTPQEFASSP
ncbi:MAG TPA: BolA family protein [Candidatus Omnitrophota bacterium]|nr:BolA family protein [Candidatus Omnitrophota bacterium]